MQIPSRADGPTKVDFARYDMIELQVNLMNIYESIVCFFLARVVDHQEN